MRKHRIIWSVVLLVMALGTSASQLPQDVRTSGGENLQDESRATTLGFLRTINTAEAAEFAKQGSYASWLTLLEHQGEYLNSWVATYVPKAHFGNLPEVLPGLDLRLNAHADGRGYDAVVEDLTDKNGYAGLSDERGIIRECTYLAHILNPAPQTPDSLAQVFSKCGSVAMHSPRNSGLAQR